MSRLPSPRTWSRRWWVAVSLAVALLIVGSWLVLASGALGVRDVSVEGVRLVRAADVRAAAGVQPGTPLVRVDEDAVAERVRRLPAVAAVHVTRRWPHGVQISVVERVPRLAVPVGPAYRLLDRTGTAYTRVRTPPAGVVIVRLAAPGPRDPATAAALRVVTALPRAIAVRVARMEAPSADGIRLVLRDGRQVVWGNGDRSTDKSTTLTTLLVRPGRFYDVSAPDLVTVRR